jgi:uncharacterized membrane protein YraQ (UPF0718 family)
VPLAAVLWNGGISFGGVMSFVFADLLIIPILVIYRKYYGLKATAVIALTFYLAMALAGYVVELVFAPLGLIPRTRNAAVLESAVSWNYTTWLNIVFLALAAFLLVVFVRSGSWSMLRMMGGSPDAGHDHASMGHDHAHMDHAHMDHARHAHMDHGAADHGDDDAHLDHGRHDHH